LLIAPLPLDGLLYYLSRLGAFYRRCKVESAIVFKRVATLAGAVLQGGRNLSIIIRRREDNIDANKYSQLCEGDWASATLSGIEFIITQ
jgi:hypothetical protein